MSDNVSSGSLAHRIGPVRTGRLVIGAVCTIVFAGYTWKSFDIPLGTMGQPGAGLFPRLVGFAALAISVLVIVESLVIKRDPAEDEEFEIPRGVELRHVLVFFCSTALMALLLPTLGQYLAGTIYSYALMMYLGERRPINWLKSAIYAVILGVLVPYAFIQYLQVMLPDGKILPNLFPGLY